MCFLKETRRHVPVDRRRIYIVAVLLWICAFSLFGIFSPAIAAPSAVAERLKGENSADVYRKDRVLLDRVLADPNASERFRERCSEASCARIDLGTGIRFRHSIDSDMGRFRLSQLSRAIHAMRYVDDRVPEGNLPGGGYQIVRVVHGVGGVGDSDQRVAERFHADSRLYEVWLSRRSCAHGPGGSSAMNEPELFLLWHRAYLLSFEVSARAMLKLLGDKDADGFAIPYWDWIDDSRVPEVFRRSSQQDSASGMQGKSFTSPLYDQHRSVDVNNGAPLLVAADYDFLDSTGEWNSFSSQFRLGLHNEIHNGVGKDLQGSMESHRDMPDPAYAVEDPLFWVHHAFVDRLLMEWSRRHRNTAQDRNFAERLRAQWTRKRYIFPAWDGTMLIPYQPSFDELDYLGYKVAMGISYQPATIDPKPGLTPPRQADWQKLPESTVEDSTKLFGRDKILDVVFDKPVTVSGDGAIFNLRLSWQTTLRLKAVLYQSSMLNIQERRLRLDLQLAGSDAKQASALAGAGPFDIYAVADVDWPKTPAELRSRYIGTLSWFGDSTLSFDATPAVQRLMSDKLTKLMASELWLRLVFVKPGFSRPSQKGFSVSGFTVEQMH